MKIFLNTTLALSTICVLEANQPAQATLLTNDANFHLARGRMGGRVAEPARRAEEETNRDMGEGRNLDASSEGHTSEESRVEDREHTLSGEASGKDVSSEGVTDGGREHRYDGEDWGTGCESGMVVDGVCVPSTEGTSSGGNSSDWTTVQ